MNLIQYLPVRVAFVLLFTLTSLVSLAQPGGNPCGNNVQVTVSPSDSRCRATGSIAINVTGGSGQYNYRVTGPISTSYTSSNSISGLAPGIYTVYVNDIVNACVSQISNVVIDGSYADPRFTLTATDITCKNAKNGTLTSTAITGGRPQFWFTIVSAPTVADIGRSNGTGIFTGLGPGDYAVQLEDSCGGIQTRRETILPYDWWIESFTGTVAVCSTANFNIVLRDSRGKSTPDPVFNNFTFGWVRNTNDTAWSTTPSFSANILNRRSVKLVVKDACGNILTVPWANTNVPSVAANVSTTQSTCNVFSAQVTGVVNMTNPQFCLYNSLYDQIACNSTGLFSNLSQDNYTVEIRDLCYDTLIRRSFSLVNPKPAVTASPQVNRVSCTLFNVQMMGLVNFTNPQFCIFRNNVQLSCNNTGLFKNLPNGVYEIRITDGCYDTTVLNAINVQPLLPSIDQNVNIYNRTCTTFDVSATGQTNLTLPQYSLWKNNVQIASNTTGIFTNLLYGDYCIKLVNSPTCYDTTITRCFQGRPLPPTVAENLTITRECDVVTLAVDGQQNLSNPQYCIFDSNGSPQGCNSTGTFPDLPYGSYCIRIINDAACYDTTIERCIIVQKLKPSVGAVSQSNASCLSFDAQMTGQFSVYNPVYTLKDSVGNIVSTNTSGQFTGLPYGNYCIELKNDPLCYDTTIVRCFAGQRPVPSGGTVNVSNQTCPTFTATLNGLVNFSNPVYTLKDSAGNVLATNSTGVFNSLSYQDYCMEIRNDPACYDTTIVRCFTAVPPVPSVDSVLLDGYTCGTFNATVTGQYLLTNPVYNLKDSAGVIIATNNAGTFTDLPYGRYTIEVVDGCYPTPFIRSFNATRPTFQIDATAIGACVQGKTTISVNLQYGSQPYVVTVYDPTNNVAGNVVSNAGIVEVRDLPSLPSGMQYRVVVVDSCGRTGTQLVTPVLSVINKSIQFVQRCPSGAQPNGSSDIKVTASSTAGSVYPAIISKNGITVNINYANQAGRTFTFTDLEPATYVVMYNLPNGCANKLYDTVVVGPYTYPVIANAAVYQCSNNSFTVSAEISGGAPIYQYQIIGSTPAAPSINTGWQTSPVFTINNGASYSLVRLRAIDACGNAALNDAFVLPLQNLIVTATSSCLYTTTTLSVDYLANADYKWYKMQTMDSTYLGGGHTYTISDVAPADTGIYKVIMSVNNGCLDRAASFDLTGECLILPVKEIRLNGEKKSKAASLKWNVKGEKNVSSYYVEYSTDQNSGFRTIGSLNPKKPQGDNNYGFSHENPAYGSNYYRIRVVDVNGRITYSNTITLNWTGRTINVYPVPAGQVVYVNINSKQSQDLKIQLYNLNGQLLQEKLHQRVQNAVIPIQRNNYTSGMYLLRITDINTGTVQTEKIIFD